MNYLTYINNIKVPKNSLEEHFLKVLVEYDRMPITDTSISSFIEQLQCEAAVLHIAHNNCTPLKIELYKTVSIATQEDLDFGLSWYTNLADGDKRICRFYFLHAKHIQ